MKRVWGTIQRLAIAAAIACATATAALADRVELANGDALTGRVVAQTKQAVTLEHPALGKITIPADRVKKITRDADGQAADKPKPDKPAKPSAADPPRQSKDTPQKDPKAIKAKAAKAAAKQKPATLDGFLKAWKSQIALGINGATGSTDRQNYYAKLDSKYEQSRHRWLANARWFYATTEGVTTQNQLDANLTKDWLKKDSNWFFFLKGQYKYDTNRAWENRVSGFGGGGYTLAKTGDVEINTRIGFGGTYEFGDINDFTPEALFGGSVLKWNLTERAALAGQSIYYPSLEDSAEFRVETKFEWTYKLDVARGLSLKIGMENEYDSRTPGDDANNDLKYFAALALSF